MKKKLTLLIIFNIFTQFLFSEIELIDQFYLNGISKVEGHAGETILQLSQNEFTPEPETDILLHFNENFNDSTDNYMVSEEYKNINSKEKKLGQSSAYFLKNKAVTYRSKGDTIFSPGRVVGDFTIEFWAYPTIISEDTTFFTWNGVNKVDTEFIPQKIKCYIEERTIIWDFENLFVTSDFKRYSIKLKSSSRIIPKQWNHYMLRYSSDTGLIEFLLNGIPESVKYTTEHQKEDNKIYSPYIGNFSKDEIYIGPKFRGFIDEFRISEKFIENPSLEKFKSYGSFYTKVYKLNDKNVHIENILIDDNIKAQTDIHYFYRISDQPFTTDNSILSWNRFEDTDIEIDGKYIQIKGELLGNGDSTISPEINSINVEWKYITPPPAPGLIKTVSNKNSITVKWNPVQYVDIDGYILYYGEKSNDYIHKIDVGTNNSYTIEGLNSNKIYYFSVRSYTNNYKSEYSIETYNRPE